MESNTLGNNFDKVFILSKNDRSEKQLLFCSCLVNKSILKFIEIKELMNFENYKYCVKSIIFKNTEFIWLLSRFNNKALKNGLFNSRMSEIYYEFDSIIDNKIYLYQRTPVKRHVIEFNKEDIETMNEVKDIMTKQKSIIDKKTIEDTIDLKNITDIYPSF